MTDKTKNKIEATYKKDIDLKPDGKAASEWIYLEGATPWAEWCESLAKSVVAHYCSLQHQPCEHCKTLEEYRQWLEDVE